MVKCKCPECGAELDLEDPVIREIVECPDCGSELEVVSIENDKVELKVAELEGEDWGE
ncbi:MAG: lysine biosynthesis protein LysW [Candidatus Freyarchaeota archaeon]|nr:lysine biosynthesis protein LysW [Candidatus Freyarchaeota archaeon]MDO8091480.1 lysine biosynthesis protein LysW [Candidatus Sigynarchaeota archaeon]